MSTFTVVVLVAFLLFTVIGVVMSRSVKDTADYFVAGRNAGVLLIVGTLVASYLSTVAMMGEAGFAYDGFAWVTLLIGAISQTGYMVGVLLFGRYLSEADTLTIPEYFGRRFNSRRLRGLAGISVLIGIGLYLVAVTRGISLVVTELTGISGVWAVAITWAAFTLFTVLSGSKGVIVTDTIMFLIFTIGGTAAFLSVIYSQGGFREVFSTLAANPEWRDGFLWHGAVGPDAVLASPLDSLVYIVTFGVVWMFVIAVSPWQASRYLMAKSPAVALRAGAVALVVVLAFYTILLFTAYSINITNPAITPSENVFIWAAENIMPLGLGLVLVVGLMAAGLSSASTFLSLVGFSAIHDVVPWVRKGASPADSPEGGVQQARIAMLIVGLAALVITVVASPKVLDIGYMAAAFFAASWGCVAFASTQSARITERGAFYGMLCGGVAVLILRSLDLFVGVSLPVMLDPVIVGLIVSLGAIIVGSMTSQPTEPEIRYLTALKKKVERSTGKRELVVSQRYLMVSAVLTFLLILGIGVLYVPAMMRTA